MFDRLSGISLRKKFYTVFCIMVVGAVSGIVIGQLLLARVQVGGKAYTEIMRNMQTANDITKLLLNINLTRGRVAALMAEKDRSRQMEHIEVIKEQTARIDALFSAIGASVAESGLADVVALISTADKSWTAMKETRDNKVIPLILDGDLQQAREIGEGIQRERVLAMSGATAEADARVNTRITVMVDKMKRESAVVKWAYIAGGGLFIGFLVVLARIFAKTIISPILMVSNQSRGMAEGNFRSAFNTISRNDEIGMMMKDFTTMSEKISIMAGRIKTGVLNLSSASEELSATADGLNKGSQEQSRQGNEVVRAISEMSQTIIEVARNAGQAADKTKDSSGQALSGKETVELTVSTMLKIADEVKEAMDTIQRLDRSAAQIGEIVAVINDIADQTNLLALNAAIEAARAGEQGRGFAIVADEVRKLAERTARATHDIKQRITTIQAEAAQSVQAMQKGNDEVGRGVSIAREASQSMESIVMSSSDVVDMVRKIAVATEEQSAATEEVTQNMEGISGLINRSAEATDQISQSARDLAHLSAEIQGYMDWFKIDDRQDNT
ncbi:MAG: methyl-accepting chemotaxis protein [Nitrospirae bacterium]|nr:methyl-accepting chemotaxis protein [Nitrospirota bacterium]